MTEKNMCIKFSQISIFAKILQGVVDIHLKGQFLLNDSIQQYLINLKSKFWKKTANWIDELSKRLFLIAISILQAKTPLQASIKSIDIEV